jgi:CheY-like chemotaxis protein
VKNDGQTAGRWDFWNKARPLILLIEDDEGDVFLFRRALGVLGFDCDVRIAMTIKDARAYMEYTLALPTASYYRLPALIVSDFRLGAHTATEFVQWLRHKPEFQPIPVVMLSGLVSAINEADFAGLDVKSFVRKTGDVRTLSGLLLPLLELTQLRRASSS